MTQNEPALDINKEEQGDTAAEQNAATSHTNQAAPENRNATDETAEQGQAEPNTGSSEESVSTEAIQQELAQLRQLNEEYQQRWLRAQADFDNYRKRTLKEKEDLLKYASFAVFEQLLPVIDNFERAMQASKSNNDYDSLSKGLDMIIRQLGQVLEQEGVVPIEAVGQPFNPEYHQAVAQVESGEEEGIIVEELQKGYKLKDRVIRPSMVKVSM